MVFLALLLSSLTATAALPAQAQQPNDLAISVQLRTTYPNGRGSGVTASNRGDEVIARIAADDISGYGFGLNAPSAPVPRWCELVGVQAAVVYGGLKDGKVPFRLGRLLRRPG